MPGLTRTAPQIYLSAENGELVLHTGLNSKQSTESNSGIIVVGGGVTGLTVSSYTCFQSLCSGLTDLSDSLGTPRRWIFSNSHL